MCTRSELNIILTELIKAYRAIYGNRIKKIVLYGSYARGDYCEDSDVDVVAIVNGSRTELQEELKVVWDRANDLEIEYEVLVSPTVIPSDEYEEWKESIPYYENIEKEGVVVHE